MPSSRMLRHVALVRTDVSEELSASIIRVRRICELGTTLLVTANVPSSPILVTLMMEALRSPKRWLLQEPHGVTSQKTAFFIPFYCQPLPIPEAGFEPWQGKRIFMFSGSETQPASYPTGTGLFSWGLMRTGREANRLPPTSTDVKNGGGLLLLLYTFVWSDAHFVKDRTTTLTFHPPPPRLGLRTPQSTISPYFS
jgi:hypothetical protein